MLSNDQTKPSDSINALFKEDAQYPCKMQKVSSLVSTITVKDDDVSDGAIGNDEFSENRLFISNFPFEWKEDDLRDFLKEYGPVESVEIVYNERGSKGFGFATINDPKRCLEARRALNHTEANGRRIEIRRAHRHKRATNTGPPQGQKQMAAEDLRQIQNLNALLVSQLPQLQQSLALQAMLAQPAMLTLLQNQLTASALMKNYQMGLSSSWANVPNLSNGGALPTMGTTQSTFNQAQQMGAGNEQQIWKTPVRSGREQENAKQMAPKMAKNGFSRELWPYSPRKEVSPNATPRRYNLFDTPAAGSGNTTNHAQPFYTSAQNVGLDDEGHIEFSHVPLYTSTPLRRRGWADLSFSAPDIDHIGRR